MSKIKLALIAGVLATGLSAGAQAMPVSNLATIDSGAHPEATRWVCNAWGRCWWRPNYYYRPYAYYPGPRFYGGRVSMAAAGAAGSVDRSRESKAAAVRPSCAFWGHLVERRYARRLHHRAPSFHVRVEQPARLIRRG